MEDKLGSSLLRMYLVFAPLIYTTFGTYHCYNAETRSYNGTVSIPLEEPYTCLYWNDPAIINSPNVSSSMEPNVDYPENYCRFIADHAIPVCFVRYDNITIYPMFCYIFACDAHAGCMTDGGADYRDAAMFVEEGYRCMYWMDAYNEPVNPNTYPDADLTENYCRNPDQSERPWCYYNSTGQIMKKGFCQIEQCRLKAALEVFRRSPRTTLDIDRAPKRSAAGVESAEVCADWCKRERQFTCASFIYMDFTKHIGPKHQFLELNCFWTNISIYTLLLHEDHAQEYDDFYYDLFTRMDNLCDYYLVDTYPELCPLPLGLETGVIEDTQINASSSLPGHPPQYARLNGNSSWIPRPEDESPWIQFKFPERMIFTGVVVQGGGDQVDAWVDRFAVQYSYSQNDLPMHLYGEYGKEFRANAEPNCPRAIYFDPPIRARTLRIVVSYGHLARALRMEVLGCRDNDCDYTLGLINGQSHDSQITALSSLSNAIYSPSHSRLQPSYGRQGTGWRPSFSSPGQYLQIDFLEDMSINAVVTQGCGDSELRVRAFTISWKREKEDKFQWIRDGHYKTNTTITNTTEGAVFVEVPIGVFPDNASRVLYRNGFKVPLVARKVRIYPNRWDVDICMRVEFIGCKHQVCVDRLGMEAGDILDSQISRSSHQSTFTESRFARLYGDRCWMPEKWASHHYIQIDFNGLHTITGLITQGGRAEEPREADTMSAWAENFRLLYRSRDSNTWKVYKDLRGRDVEFVNFPDPDTETRHVLDRPIMTDGIRINPKGFQNNCLRLEFIGCDVRKRGHICEGKNTEHHGYCLRTVDTQESTGCEDIFTEGSHSVVIQSARLQKFFEDKKERFQLPYIYQYVIGLKKITSHKPTPFVWLPDTLHLPTTYENFRWLPDSISNNNTIEMCVYLDMDDSMKWRAFSCRDVIVSRATICQIDMDECLKEHESACSHRCLNVPGSFQCQCPRGFYLPSLDGTICRRLQIASTPLIVPSTEYDDLSPEYDFDYDYGFDGTPPPVLMNFTSPIALITTINTSHIQQLDHTIPDEVFAEISDKQLADIRCEDLWLNSTSPMTQTTRRTGIVQAVTFAPLYNTEQLCEMRIIAEDGYFVKFTFQELFLRKSVSSDYCVDVLNITDNFQEEGPMLRGSYCGGYRQMVVTSRSSNVTMRFAIGELEADMPKKLGFIATYETIKFVGTGKGCQHGCGGTEIYRGLNGSFSINNVDMTLAPFSFCNWSIRLPVGKYVALNFTRFDVGRNPLSGLCTDSVEIVLVADGRSEGTSHAICGDQAPYILTNTTRVKVIFRTGLEVRSEGFQVDYDSKATPGCGIGTYTGDAPIECSSQSAFIASINFPHPYLPNQNTTWYIRTEVGTYVELIFHRFNVTASRDCLADYVRIHEEEYGMRFCNSNPPLSPVLSSFNTLVLVFVSDYTLEASGFFAEYKAARFTPQETASAKNETPGISCPPDWVLFKRHCYKFKTAEQKNRWTDAQRDCEVEGATLVSIGDIEEMEFVHAALTSVWLTNNTKTYIGLQLDHSRRVHVWRDDTPMSYSDWSVPTQPDKWKMRQPNGGEMEECSLIELTNLHSTNHWHDVPCASTDTSQYICERSAETLGNSILKNDNIGDLVKRACPDGMNFTNYQCIMISGTVSYDEILQNNTCPPSLYLLSQPDSSRMEFYMDYVASYDGVLPVLVNIANRENGTLCTVLRIEGERWKMLGSWCTSDMKFGGVICTMLPYEEEQVCHPNLFQCSSEECVQRVQLCDGTRNCQDGSDEDDCSAGEIESEFFRCGSGEHLQISFLCDHDPQCLDGSDESDCEYPACSDDEFTCANNQCISMDRRCDLIPHCVDGTDETDCESSDVGFQCYDGNWIPQRAYCDGVKDCQGNSWEDEPQKCRPDPLQHCGPGEVQCGSGDCVDRSTLCLYDFDRYGYQTGCRDVAHLRHCGLFECNNFTFKCHQSYCIPLHRRCDERWDCPSGEDERGCENYTCPMGAYSCRESLRCLTQDLVCDGVKQCPAGDDEWLCAMECPAGCVCTGLSYSCDVISDAFLTGIPPVVRRLNLSNTIHSLYAVIHKRSIVPERINLSIHDTGFLEQLHRFTMLTELDLSRSRMRAVEAYQFQHQVNLRSLYLSENLIEVLEANSFAGLGRLTYLNIIGNPISKIERNAFLHLARLPVLNLNGLHLGEIYPGMFSGLTNLRNLSLRGNPIDVIQQHSFVGLNATSVLDVSDIGATDSLPVFGLDVFYGLDNLSIVVASNYVFCCLISHSTTCDAPLEQFSSCKDLMRYTFLRICMWLLGLSALLGNTFVLIWRWYTWRRESAKRVQTFLIINLALADFLMGVYMITIAGADMFYRDRYMIHADQWTRSFLCQMAGLLSVLSSEASVFLLVLITIDRFLGVVFPFSAFRFQTKSVRVVVLCAWVLALFLSTLPLLLTPGEQFYGRSSVCLALPLTSDKPPGWLYSVVLFVGVNLACFTLIFVCYFIMFVAIRNASRQSTRRREVAEEVKMATKMALIVGTDLLCWMPIIIMALLSLTGAVQIPQDIYAVVAVFILPVNSAANPYLYTISTLDRSCEKTFRRGSTASPTPSTWKSDCTRDLSINEIELVKVLRTNSSQPPNGNDKHKSGIMPAIIADLSESHLLPILTFRCRNIILSKLVTRPEWHLKESEVTTIENDLKKALDMLHRCGFLHGNVNEDHVVIDQSNRTGAYLIMRGGEIESAEDAFGASDDESSDEGNSGGSIYENHQTNIVDQGERVSLIRKDLQQLKLLIQRLGTLC